MYDCTCVIDLTILKQIAREIIPEFGREAGNFQRQNTFMVAAHPCYGADEISFTVGGFFSAV
jgi:hypothetical protein